MCELEPSLLAIIRFMLKDSNIDAEDPGEEKAKKILELCLGIAVDFCNASVESVTPSKLKQLPKGWKESSKMVRQYLAK